MKRTDFHIFTYIYHMGHKKPRFVSAQRKKIIYSLHVDLFFMLELTGVDYNYDFT